MFASFCQPGFQALGQTGFDGFRSAAFEFVAVSAPQPEATSASAARIGSDASVSFLIYSR